MGADTARAVRWIIDHISDARALVVGDGVIARGLGERGVVGGGAVSAVVVDWTSHATVELNVAASVEPGSTALAIVSNEHAARAFLELTRSWDIVELKLWSDTTGFRGTVVREPREQAELADRFTELLTRAAAEAALESDRLASALRDVERELHETRRALRRRTIQALEASQHQQIERERLETRLRNAELAAEKVRGTLSYRLGHTLIHKSKSLAGLRELPATLWRINQDAAALRKRRDGPRGRVPALLDTALGWRERLRRPTAPAAKARISRRRDARDHRRRFEAPVDLSTAAGLRQLRVACVMDEFTTRCFDPECQLIGLDAARWREQVEETRPHLLFIESAWQGQSGSWRGKIPHQAPELKELITWCRDHGIPTAFWNKEDPVHFGSFLNTASMFDAVFTTDFDCIHRYQRMLEHDRVYLLPFACQPALHNPLEVYDRKDAACFAGAYYARYPERQRDFLRILIQLLDRGPVEIYDRSHGQNVPADYQFPEPYQEFIIGNLPYAEIDKAYKGYRYGININSIKYSQTMFARRVFELLASNTLTVSNFSRGIRLMFGELVISTDDAEALGRRLAALDGDPAMRDRFRLAGLRTVLSQHTYRHRLGFVASKIFGVEPPALSPAIAVAGFAETDVEAKALQAAFARQRYSNKQLVVLTPASADQPLPDADYVAWLSPRDHYGEHYLLDLALATTYFDGPAIGKASAYRWTSGRLELEGGGLEYRTGQRVPLRAALVKSSALPDAPASAMADQRVGEALAIDRFGYCRDGALGDSSRIAARVGALPGLDHGIPLAELLDEAAQIHAASEPEAGQLRELGPPDLAAMFESGLFGDVAVASSTDGLEIESSLADDSPKYLYEPGDRALAELGFEHRARFNLEVTPGLRVEAVLVFFDHVRRRLGHEVKCASMNQEVELPLGAAFVRLGLRIVGPGAAVVKRWSLGHLASEEPTRILGRSDTLLVTNNYPSAEHLYRNAFVHRRVVGYHGRGARVDCFCMQRDAALTYYEFEGVEVTVGNADSLRRALESNDYRTVLVHFLDEEMWRVLTPHLDSTRVVVWLHGSEIQPWHRRRFDLDGEKEIEAARGASDRRMALWRRVLEPMHPNLELVFVSDYFAREVQQDYGIELPASQIHIIHNVIDTELFAYRPKEPEQRLRILSIRPFASRKYANDLSVAAIVELSKRPWFEQLDIRIIGDGVRFDQELAPLRGMGNVTIERRFLTQPEIAELFGEYGVFLCPTRLDAQGVSRDEAMAAGLVPVTTAIAAVPEFVDADCGFLANPEDPLGLAAAIESLYRDPDLFARLSANAASRVRGQSSVEQTIPREVALFTKG